MRRRRALRLLATGVASAIAGCPSGNAEVGTPRPDRPGIVTYPEIPPTVYIARASTVEKPENTPKEFETLPKRVRLEVANAIHRDEYTTAKPPEISGMEGSVKLVDYRGQTFDLGVAHGDGPRKPEYGPASASAWEDPVRIDASISGGELTVALHNELEQPIAVNHFGRPYFGVLVAVGTLPVVLDHIAYETNDQIRTDDLVQTEDHVDRPETKRLASGNVLRETYGVPKNLSGESLVRISTEIGGESADWLGNRATKVATTRRIEF